MAKVVAIVPLRNDSRRLPRKHLRDLAGRPLIDLMVQRLRGCAGLDAIVLATTERTCDDPLAVKAEALGLTCFRGAVDDVLGRCAAAASEAGAKIVIKANGDSPLLAPEVIDRALGQLSLVETDCLTGKNGYTGLPVGLGAEILTAGALARLDRETADPAERESITGRIFNQDSGFSWAPVITPIEWRAPDLNLCVDTPEDLNRLQALLAELPPRTKADWTVPEILSAAAVAARRITHWPRRASA